MTSFVHLTDLHISHPDADDPKDRGTSRAALARVVGIINAMDPQPAFVVASGDLTNMGDEPSYSLVQELLAPLKVPLVMALGNHDLRAGFRAVFGGEGGDAPYFHDTVQGGLHVITLDTKVPERVAGAICEAQFGFLNDALQRHGDLPKLIVMHHPPRVDDSGLPWGTIDLASTTRLAEALKGHQIAGILSGHIHINQIHHWHGIPICINSGLDYTIDLLERRDLRLLEGTTMAICTHRASGLSVSFVPLSPEQEDLGIIDRARLLAFT
ncbi:phosphodiesterase [Sulfitobacter sp. M57]|uniref:metallophosphoesterase family protein n=1 Tax=unclassified Sulfitobacter TaxID=196795 RepID=UPI0023E21CAC|nr:MULTISPECIES: metallophosphoesterase [unclassified Sulfitobacter]MDF3412923.1 phosphodiesterase [Sulfitobacter sp. KE5]MDF3421793.1 phosphodiesterase [Sulfitobacter sp. KE43]MDF3431472.1 phosphodiesterase [Sulfitobacter sp. KE42]MDF3457113.1 phosphodiesterase [Sulfitobacter sp. S74]MDF3461016.1 phosphodiesterase [Sulfitobacter sp. Ks18]